jgi:hypothetical protein
MTVNVWPRSVERPSTVPPMYTTVGSLGSSTSGVSVVHRMSAGHSGVVLVLFGKLHRVVVPPPSWKPEQFCRGGWGWKHA